MSPLPYPPYPNDPTRVNVERVKLFLDDALQSLGSRERSILHLYFGFDGRPHNFTEIARSLRRSRELIRQIVTKALTSICLYAEKAWTREALDAMGVHLTPFQKPPTPSQRPQAEKDARALYLSRSKRRHPVGTPVYALVTFRFDRKTHMVYLPGVVQVTAPTPSWHETGTSHHIKFKTPLKHEGREHKEGHHNNSLWVAAHRIILVDEYLEEVVAPRLLAQ